MSKDGELYFHMSQVRLRTFSSRFPGGKSLRSGLLEELPQRGALREPRAAGGWRPPELRPRGRNQRLWDCAASVARYPWGLKGKRKVVLGPGFLHPSKGSCQSLFYFCL